MRLDVVEIDRLLESRLRPVYALEPAIYIRVIVPNGADIALEVTMIYGIEANDRRKEANIGFRQLVSYQVRLVAL